MPSKKSQKIAAKSRMSVEYVRMRVSEVEAAAIADDAYGHAEADDLLIDVLQAIADGAPNAKELACEALKAEDAKFTRRFE